MIERVAKAIAVRHGVDLKAVGPGKSHVVESGGLSTIITDWRGELWRMFIPDARAAIEAMREPVEAMAATIYDNCTAWECFRADGEAWDAERVYRAMIDAALKDASERQPQIPG